jgi:hypothetical protein
MPGSRCRSRTPEVIACVGIGGTLAVSREERRESRDVGADRRLWEKPCADFWRRRVRRPEHDHHCEHDNARRLHPGGNDVARGVASGGADNVIVVGKTHNGVDSDIWVRKYTP